MKLLRYILSHGILLLLIVALAFAYYYRTQLFSDDINARIDNVMHKSVAWLEVFKDKQAEKPSTSEAPEASMTVIESVEQPIAEAEMPVPATVKEDEPTVKEEQQADIPLPTEEQQTQQEAMPIPAPASSADVAMADSADTAQEPVAPDNDQIVAADSQAALLDQARIAFQTGQPDQAVKLYQELSELNPDDPNVYGELGNVLYAQGKWQQAGEAYYEAASRLLERGQSGQVQYLYRVIQGLDAESAEKLRSRMGQ